MRIKLSLYVCIRDSGVTRCIQCAKKMSVAILCLLGCRQQSETEEERHRDESGSAVGGEREERLRHGRRQPEEIDVRRESQYKNEQFSLEERDALVIIVNPHREITSQYYGGYCVHFRKVLVINVVSLTGFKNLIKNEANNTHLVLSISKI